MDSQKLCPKCHGANRSAAKFCKFCGTPLMIARPNYAGNGRNVSLENRNTEDLSEVVRIIAGMEGRR